MWVTKRYVRLTRDLAEAAIKVAGFDPSFETESFGISPDGKRIVVAALERTYGIVAIEGFADAAKR